MMWIFWILIIVVLVWFVAFVTRREDVGGRREKSALEILEERYARGEIDHDELDQKRKDLKL